MKVKENYLRRYAKRLGLTLKKSKAKKWRVNNQCGYMLVKNDVSIMGMNFELSMDDVETFLYKYETELKNSVRGDSIGSQNFICKQRQRKNMGES